MTTLRLYVGIGFSAKTFAREVALPFFGGATVQESLGMWQAPDGEHFIEAGHVITIAVDSLESAEQLIKFAQRHAYQAGEQSVMVEYRNTVTFHDAAA